MKKHNLAQKGKRALSMLLVALMVLSCWVWVEPNQLIAEAANETVQDKDHFLFAYFTGTSKEGQTIHLAVSEDGYNYTALRNNEPVIIPSKGVGNVRDPYIWYNEQDNYYYILATDLDFTDGGGTYSNNSQSFIIWRSKDLVNWYDETFIDVSKMAHLIGDTRNMSAVWAPQVLWDGSAYVVYFTLACNATSWFDIVYLKTTDLLDPNAYYEFDYILGNGTGNGTDNGYGVIDADIIHNPGDGKYYLFYKTECNANELGTTNKGTSLKTIHYYVGDTPTGPFTNPGDTKWSNAGFSIFPDYNVSLEGCNSFWDNDGNLIMYADEFEHTNASGEAEAYFHIAKSNGTNFKSWSYPDVSQHNINSLSPRHGSVVKITEAEYNRLLNNSYNITSSSYPDTEVLEDHLVARYFTTADVNWNAVIGQPNLASSTGITMVDDTSIGYYASFDSTNGGWAEVDFDSLFRKTNGLNYEDGFTITFSAMLQPNSSTNNENNDRIYEIADVFGSRTGTEHYTHFSPGGGGNGSYLGNYNGPVDSGNDWLNDINRANRDDKCFHEYIISYATGNVMVYVDGQLVISRNRFTGVKLDDSWYEALGSNATMRIGRSGWDADPLFKGNIQNLCIYDCSMSYYDAQSMNDDYKENHGWVNKANYTGIETKVPTFQNTNADRMNSLPNKNQHFSNILYTSETVKNYDGNNMSADSAVWHSNGNDFYFALYYPETTVLLYDGVNDAIMPVSFGAYCENSRASKGFLQIYPTTGPGSTADLGELEISQNWAGWYNNGDYYNCIVEHADGYIGRNSTTSSWSHITDKKNYDCHWGAPLKVNGDTINFNGMYYKKYNLTWQVNGGTDGNYAADHSANMTSDNDIYVINFKPILDLRNTITEDMYNEVMNNSALCPELREKYAAAVYAIRTMDPTNYGFDAAPLTATKACAKAISEAIGTYEGVIAEIAREETEGTYGHQCTELEAREATCAVNGLTAGSYCVLCGEIVEKQQTLATTGHTFGAEFTEDGVKYKQCSVCGVKIEYQASGVRYANLFSFNRWVNSASNGVFSGTISTNSANGTITIVNQNNSEIYTRGTYDGQNLVATRDFGNDCIPVTGGKTYVVEATSLASSTSGGEVFVFQYNKDGLAYSAIPTVLGLAPGQTAHNEFTVDKNAAYIELRFDCNDAGKTITYSQIGLYEKEEFDKFGATTADARLGFYPGESKDLCYPNPAPGYTFNGWYTVDGRLIDDVNQLNNPTTIVYGNWIEAGFDVTYDSIFSFSDWAKSSCNQLWYGDGKDANGNVTRLVSKEGILADSENGTITITNDEDTTYFARTNYWVDSANVHKMTVEPNTEYILEYTATSDDGAKPSVCLYITGGTAQYPETGNATRYSTGTHYYRFESGDNTNLTLRFDNVQHGSTVTFSNIAVYKAEFEEAARTITNREYRRYYPTKMGIGDVFEYTPTRPGYTFDTWMAETNFADDKLGDFDMKGFDDTFVVENNWQLFSTWTENSYTIKYDANGGTGSIANQTVKYTADVALASSGFTKSGHKLLGWSTIPNATSAMYQPGQTTSRLCEDNNGTVTLYAVWETKDVVVNFDNLIDYSAWNKSAGNGVVSDVTDTGFTITSNADAGEATSSSPYFTVTPGGKYKVEIDITDMSNLGGSPWDVYIFFCNESGGWVDFVDGTSNRFSLGLSNTQTNGNTYSAVFTAPDKDEVVKAQIRVDANGSNNTVRFENIRVEDTSITHTETSRTIGYGTAFGELPTPTRAGYVFKYWEDKNGDEVTKDTLVSDANMRLTSVWEQVFYTINFSANGPADLSIPNTSLVEGKDTITLPAALEYEDLEFVGWSLNQFQDPYNDEGIYGASEQVNVNEITNWEEDANKVKVTEFCAVWKLNDTAVKDDTVVADFNSPVKISPYEMGDSGVLLYHAGSMCESWSVELSKNNGDYGTFAVNDAYITYTPTKIMNGVDVVDVTVTLNYPSKAVSFTSKLTVVPASNVLYEENVLNITANDSAVDWHKTTGTETTATDLYHNKESIYGYDSAYADSTGFSNGTYLRADVTPTNKKSDTATFEFVGSGFDLISACGTNTGVQIVKISKLQSDGNYKALKSIIVDTYFTDTSIMNGDLLHQVPVVNYRGDYGTYKVETTATYLNSAGAVKKGTATIAYSSAFGDGTSVETGSGEPSKALLKELEELSFEDLGNDIEVIWMDDNSAFNGGSGSPNASIFSGSAKVFYADGETVTGLRNYIDCVRIYNPLNGGNGYYKDSEQNATYYNIVEELELDTDQSNMAYIESTDAGFSLNFGTDFNFDAYNQQGGPKGEIYLKKGDAIAFKFTAETNGDVAYAMLGMRAVCGTANASVYTDASKATPYSQAISSATEMYYDVSSAVTVVNGEVTIVVANTGEGILAVNNLKLVNGKLTVSGNNDSAENPILSGNNAMTDIVGPVTPENEGTIGSETDVDTDTNIPETETEVDAEDGVEDGTENNISVAIPGLPAPIASFLEMLFKLLSQLVSSLGF